MSLHFHPLRVQGVEADTDEALIVSFEVPVALHETFRHTQGQYLTLRAWIGGQDVRRSYSICSGIDDATLRVGIRRVPGGVFSSWAQVQLKAGDTLDVIPPQGHFFVPLEPASRRHYLGIAGGSGITPILSILKSVLAREPGSRFTLIYGNRQQKSTMFKEELEDLKNRYLTRLALFNVFSREHMEAPLCAGRITPAKLGEFLGPLIDPQGLDHAFVCGPHGLNEGAEAALRAAGIPAERIHVERFGAPPEGGAAVHSKAPGDAEQAMVTVVRDGLRREVEFHDGDASLLDAMSRAGLEVPYSCKSGVCSTCRARLLEGQVRMDRNFALEKAELAAGFVLTCQAHPTTPRVVLSFDAR
jgi:ring-1,2-phenylacetyl-CoA epoxidase subunit PaaE